MRRFLFWFCIIAGALLAAAVVVFGQDVFDGCGMAGTAKGARVQAINRLKNRYTPPTADDIDPLINLGAMLAPGDDTNRWRSSKAADLIGFVLDVVPGGQETCNCGKNDPPHRDVHIELVLTPADTEIQSVVVEVTPRVQRIMAARGIDWSEKALRKKILHKWVKVRAWMMFDAEHKDAAENTSPTANKKPGKDGKKPAPNWRGTAWEGHPVFSISVVSDESVISNAESDFHCPDGASPMVRRNLANTIDDLVACIPH